GVTFQSQRADPQAEFIASSDNFFRPVNFINAPDGTLHVVDMYREVVEGPSWVPEDLKKQGLVDVLGATDRGRIYRLSPPGFKVPAAPRLAAISSTDLVPYLEHANAWYRETAQRLLIERQDQEVVRSVRQLFISSRAMPGRLHALWTLDGMGELRDEDLLRAVKDPSSVVREHAVLAAEPRLRDAADSSATHQQLVTSVLAMAGDKTMRVRFQLAMTLGEIRDKRTTIRLAEIIERDVADPWMRTAVLSSSVERAADLLVRLLANGRLVGQVAGDELLKELAFTAGAERTSVELREVVSAVARLSNQQHGRRLQSGLVDRLLAGGQLAGREGALQKIAGELISELLPRARTIASQEEVVPGQRVDAIRLMALDQFSQVGDLLAALVDASQPVEVQRAAVRTLSRFSEAKIASVLLDKWAAGTPVIRGEIISALMLRENWTGSLLTAIEEKRVLASEVGATTRSRLVGHKSAVIKKQASALLAEDVIGARHEVIQQYQPVLKLTGDAARGKAVFLRECIGCHRFGSQGHDVGPNLSNYGRKKLPPDSLMIQILDPNRLVAANYMSYIVVLDDGRVENGMITGQTPTSVTIKRDKDVRVTILRKKIDAIKSSGKSLMPEGLEKKVNQQQMADLLEFLMSVNQRI
ncbi:MAG TPA: c-type cytochrome, partial [Planctomycetes bacterium]|nr:c-type cytochrome [Planctomycetota bacterium]